MKLTNTTGCGIIRELNGEPFYCVSDLAYARGSHVHSMRKLHADESIPIRQDAVRLHTRRDQLSRVQTSRPLPAS